LQDITPNRQIDSKPYIKGDDETYFKENQKHDLQAELYEKIVLGYRQFKV
jgi:hypothetical protein